MTQIREARLQKLESQEARRDQRERDRNADDAPPTPARPPFVRPDFRFTLDSFRRDLERPRQDERDRKSENEQQHHQPDRPVWNFEKWKDLRRDLNQQPRHDGIGDRDLVNVAALQFGEEVTSQCTGAASVPHSKSVSPSGRHPAGQPFSRQYAGKP